MLTEPQESRQHRAWRLEKRTVWVLRLDVVNALAILALAGLQLQAQFLANLRAQEAPHAVRLPAGGPVEIRERGTLLAAQQLDDRRALAVSGSLLPSHLLRLALGRLCHVSS